MTVYLNFWKGTVHISGLLACSPSKSVVAIWRKYESSEPKKDWDRRLPEIGFKFAGLQTKFHILSISVTRDAGLRETCVGHKFGLLSIVALSVFHVCVRTEKFLFFERFPME